jgi:hypothetical protein
MRGGRRQVDGCWDGQAARPGRPANAPRSPRFGRDPLTATSVRRRPRRTAATQDGPERARTPPPSLSPRPARPGGGRRDDTAQRSPQAARDGPARVARRMRDPGTLRTVEVQPPLPRRVEAPLADGRAGPAARGAAQQARADESVSPRTRRRGRLESQDPSAAQTTVPSRTRTTSREPPGAQAQTGEGHYGRHGDVPLRGGRPGGDVTAARNPSCSPGGGGRV